MSKLSTFNVSYINNKWLSTIPSLPISPPPQSKIFDIKSFNATDLFPDIGSLMIDWRFYSKNYFKFKYFSSDRIKTYGLVNLNNFTSLTYQETKPESYAAVVTDSNDNDLFIYTYGIYNDEYGRYECIIEIYSLPDFQLITSTAIESDVLVCCGIYNDMLIFYRGYYPDDIKIIVTDLDLNILNEANLYIENLQPFLSILDCGLLLSHSYGFKLYSIPDLEVIADINNENYFFQGATSIDENNILAIFIDIATFTSYLYKYTFIEGSLELVDTIELDYVSILPKYCNNRVVLHERDLITSRVRLASYTYPELERKGNTEWYYDPFPSYTLGKSDYIALMDCVKSTPIKIDFIKPL